MRWIVTAFFTAVISALVVAGFRMSDHSIDSASGRWEEYRAIPPEKAEAIIAVATKSGGICHELSPEKIMVCYYADSAGVQQAN